MTMNVNASSEGKYSVYYFSDCPDRSVDTFQCSKCLYKISDYYSEVSWLNNDVDLRRAEKDEGCLLLETVIIETVILV